MIFKKGVKVANIKPEIMIALFVADGVWRKFGQELVVTSVTDSKHGEDSLHPSGYAGDLRTHYFDIDVIPIVAKRLRNALTDEYDVVVESTHIHVEFDPK